MDGQDDLIQKIFHGLEALYFCPSYSLTVESALAVLLTSSESSTYLMGPVLSDQVDWLMELVSGALSFEYIQVYFYKIHSIFAIRVLIVPINFVYISVNAASYFMYLSS